MKQFILILLLLPLLSQAQNASIPRKAQFIDIHNKSLFNMNYLTVRHMLSHQNLKVEREDKEIGLIITQPKEFKEHSIFYKIVVKDSLITVSGMYKKLPSGTAYEPIRAQSKLSNNQEGKRAMRQMIEVAKDFGNQLEFRR